MSTSNMPARIWAETVDHPWSLWSVAKESGDDTLYIRADLVEAMAEALEAADGRITALYSAINPHANYYDGGNRMADSDEVAQQARTALNSYREDVRD